MPDGSLARLLRDRFVFDPTICAAELGLTLAEMPAHRRPLFLASLVGGGGSGGATASAAAAAAGCWEAIDAAIRAEVPSLFETLSQARGPPEAGAPPPSLRVALMVLDWYVTDPPPPAARRREVPRGLLGCGATQAMLQLVLAGDDGAAAAAVLLGGVWRWPPGACSRYAEILAWVQQVPRLPDAIRASSHLRERKAQAVCWLLLLASAPANSASSSAPKAAAAAAARAAELRAEALVVVQAATRAPRASAIPWSSFTPRRRRRRWRRRWGAGDHSGRRGGRERRAGVGRLHRRLRAALAAEEAAENATAPPGAPPPVQVGGGRARWVCGGRQEADARGGGGAAATTPPRARAREGRLSVNARSSRNFILTCGLRLGEQPFDRLHRRRAGVPPRELQSHTQASAAAAAAPSPPRLRPPHPHLHLQPWRQRVAGGAAVGGARRAQRRSRRRTRRSRQA